MSIESVMLCNYLILCHPLLFCRQSFPASGGPFPMSQLFESGGQSIGTSASASVLPMNVQGWFPLEWTGLISLQSKGLSRVFSSSTVRKHQFFGAQPSLWSNFTSIHEGIKPLLGAWSLNYWTRKVPSVLFKLIFFVPQERSVESYTSTTE